MILERNSLLEQKCISTNEVGIGLLAECKSLCDSYDRLETTVDDLNKKLEDGHKKTSENEKTTQELVRQLEVITDYGLFQFLYWDLSICLL